MKAFRATIRLLGGTLTVSTVYKNTITSSGLTGNDITCAVPDEEASGKVDVPAPRGAEEHPGLRFPTLASGILAVRTHDDVIDFHGAAQPNMHRLDGCRINEAVADIRLIGHDDDDKTGSLEAFHSIRSARQQPEVSQAARRVGFRVTDLAAVQHAVAVEKNGANTGGA